MAGLALRFVTPSALPTWARVAIGVAALAAFLTYVFTLGRTGYRRGVTGDVDASLQAAAAPTAA